MREQVLKMLRDLAIYESMLDHKYEAMAYERAKETIDGISEEELKELIDTNQLLTLPYVGEAISSKIYEFCDSGKINKLEEYKKEIPVDIDALIKIRGLGPKTMYKLFTAFGVKKPQDIIECRGKIKDLPRMGEKAEDKLIAATTEMLSAA